MQRITLIKQAWFITQHYKALWGISLFGSVAFFVFEALYHPQPPFEESIDVIESLFVLYAAVPVVVLFLTTAFVSGALISLVNSIANHEAVTLGSGFHAGLRWMFPLTLIAIILMLPIWLMLYNPIGTLLTVFGNQFASPDSIQVTSLLNQSRFIFSRYGLILAVTLVMNAIGIGAERSVVLEGNPILIAFKRGTQLLIKRIGDFIVIGLALLGIGLVISALFLAITGPLAEFLASLLGKDVMPLYMTSPVGLLFTIANFLICAVFTVFVSSIWTLAFREWQAQERSELPVAVE
ncbi:hypothetical protein TFLX_04387 [Thermoflexales bacterium]|nr:hypothetical protein TFLX_04387 [Thermoflexales bacterium]